MSRGARVFRLLAVAGGIGVALVALSVTGGGALSPPPVTDPQQWPAWFEQREPAEAAVALLRLAAVGGCWYLALATVVGACLRMVRADGLVAVADRLTVAPVRHLLAGSLTVTLAGIGPTAALAAAAQPVAPTTTTSTTVPATITMVRLPAPGAEPEAPPPAASDPAQVEAEVGERYTVVPGDCFWTIADDLLHRSWGRPPTDAEIVPYWLRLIEVNRAELADPGNADLIFPAQVFAIPPVPAPEA